MMPLRGGPLLPNYRFYLHLDNLGRQGEGPELPAFADVSKIRRRQGDARPPVATTALQLDIHLVACALIKPCKNNCSLQNLIKP